MILTMQSAIDARRWSDAIRRWMRNSNATSRVVGMLADGNDVDLDVANDDLEGGNALAVDVSVGRRWQWM